MELAESRGQTTADRMCEINDSGPCTSGIKVEPPDYQSLQEDSFREQEVEDYDDIGEHFFESDHLALRGNTDYRNVLKTLAVLEAQRVQVIRDIETLMEVREKALADPVRFVERLQKKEDVGIPLPQTVPQVPNVDWCQYSLGSIPCSFESKRQLTRQTAKSDPKASTNHQSGNNSSVMIRGRVFNENKPATFNQLWTAEEQKRLEDLLLKYPPEEVESRRWEKIAEALGNRTTTQVASRVQKYFIKLAKAGLPVPGRIPNVTAPRRIGTTGSRRTHHHHRSNLAFSHSTFFASHRPPVYMTEGEEETGSSTWSFLESSEASGNDKSENEEEVPVDSATMETPEYRELMALKRARLERLRKAGLAQHIGFRCDRCECEPIVGTRWHCTDCPSTAGSVDFCSDCVDCMHESATHKDDHHLEPVRIAQECSTFHDRDYMSFTGADYNYLDPNYLPATG